MCQLCAVSIIVSLCWYIPHTLWLWRKTFPLMLMHSEMHCIVSAFHAKPTLINLSLFLMVSFHVASDVNCNDVCHFSSVTVVISPFARSSLPHSPSLTLCCLTKAQGLWYLVPCLVPLLHVHIITTVYIRTVHLFGSYHSGTSSLLCNITLFHLQDKVFRSRILSSVVNNILPVKSLTV